MRIREILAQNTRHRLDDPVPMEADIAKAEATLGVPSFPNDYRQFVLLGGLNDLRFTCRTWAPDQVARASSSGPPKDLLPFADDGTGNLYCWKRNELPDSPIFLWDHDTRRAVSWAASFVACLEAWRF